jgi:hypothetical protein
MTTLTADYLWAFSTVTKAALQDSANGHRVLDFPWQTHQTTPLLGWKEPQRDGTERPKRGRYSMMLDGSQRADGLWIMTLCFGVFTDDQMSYIDTNQFSSGTVEFAPATIQVYDDNARAYNAFTVTANRPVPGQDFEILDGFYRNVKYRFTAGTKL